MKLVFYGQNLVSLFSDSSQIKVKYCVLKWFHLMLLYLWKDLCEEFSFRMNFAADESRMKTWQTLLLLGYEWNKKKKGKTQSL